MNENKTFNWIHLQCEAPLAKPLLQPQLSPATPMPSEIIKQPMITDSTIENKKKGYRQTLIRFEEQYATTNRRERKEANRLRTMKP
mgnify:CR=1 FL=1